MKKILLLLFIIIILFTFVIACTGAPPNTETCTPEVRIEITTVSPVTAQGEAGFTTALVRVFNQATGEALFFKNGESVTEAESVPLILTKTLTYIDVILPETGTYIFQAVAYDQDITTTSSAIPLSFAETIQTIEETSYVALTLTTIIDNVELQAPSSANENDELEILFLAHPKGHPELYALPQDYDFPFYVTSNGEVLASDRDKITIRMNCNALDISAETIGLSEIITNVSAPWTVNSQNFSTSASVELGSCDEDSSGSGSDLIPPLLTFDSPFAKQSDNAIDIDILLSGTTEDNETDIVKVKLYEGTVYLGDADLDTKATPYQWSYIYTLENPIPNTPYPFTFTAIAEDSAGNETKLEQDFTYTEPLADYIDGDCNTLGYISTALGENSQGNAIAQKSDGIYVIAGYTQNTSTDYDFVLVKYYNDCTIDNRIALDFNNQEDKLFDLALDESNGYIWATGYSGDDMALLRFTELGEIDSDFQSFGYLIKDIGVNDIAYAVAVDNQGHVTIAGQGNDTLALVRFDSAGNLDSTFNGSGLVLQDTNDGEEAFHALIIDDNQSIIAAGQSGNDVIIMKFNSDGSMDNSFNQGNPLFLGLNNAIAYAIALDSNNNIILAGQADNAILVAKLDSTGALEQNFNNGEILNFTIGSAVSVIKDITLDGSDNIIISGYLSDTTDDFLIMRLDINGNIDTSFGDNGSIIIDIEESEDQIHSAWLDQNNRLVITGANNDNIVLMRFLP